MTYENLENKIFGDLKCSYRVLGTKYTTWMCICKCGRNIPVLAGNLKKGNSTNCGCKRKKTCGERMKTLNFKHGETNSLTWESWSSMFDRCNCETNHAYKMYGANGIKIHHDFYSYEKFKAEIGIRPSKSHSIDRINNNLGYIPGNIRWATKTEQAINRSTTKFILINGEKTYLTAAAKFYKVGKSTISRWIKSGKLELIL